VTGSAEIKVVYELTAPHKLGEIVPTVKPLVTYLRGSGEITKYLRQELANLLDESGDHALQLKLGRRDTRFMKSEPEVDRDYAAYTLVYELSGAVVTEALCHELVRRIPQWTLNRDPKTSGLVHLLENDGQTMLALPDGSPISKQDAMRFAAFETGKSFDAVKKMILSIDTLKRREWSPLAG
jgi:hypothetical protein